MTAEQILKQFEESLCERHDVYPVDGCTGTAPTGEPYVTYACQGSKEEGEAGSNQGSTPLAAVQRYIEKMALILPESRPGLRIYWRSRPEITEFEGKCDIRSRFLISGKPYFKGV